MQTKRIAVYVAIYSTRLPYLDVRDTSQWIPRQSDDRHTTYHDNSRTLQWNCNVRL